MANRQVHARPREYQKVVEALDQMIVVIDQGYRYVLANRAFLEYRGLRREQVLGHLVSEVSGQQVFGNIRKRMDFAFGGQSIRHEMTFMSPARGEREISVFYFPIEGQGAWTGWAVLWRM